MPDDLIIKLVAKGPPGRFGVMIHEGIPFAVTLEHTYDEEPAAPYTRIPAGRYLCTKTWYHRGGYHTFEIHVSGHSRILFHKLNWERQADGCVGVAESFAELDGQPAIADSRHGFEEFMEKYGSFNEFYVQFIDCTEE